jgi:4-hydroxybenzoyl-CoA thioesterase
MEFSTYIEVRFGDCDPAGIVYYPALYHYCHVAFEETWPVALGGSYATFVRVERLGFPTVHVETDFECPVRYGDTVRMSVSVPRVGRSSVDFLFQGFVDDRRVLRSRHTKVCASLDTLTSRPVPEALRAALELLAP